MANKSPIVLYSGIPKEIASTDVIPVVNGGVDQTAWTSWTPTITNLTAGTGGTVTDRYKQIGKTIFFTLDIVFGTSSTNSTTWKFTLPSASVSGRPTYAAIASNAYMYTNGFVYLIMPLLTSTTEITINLTDATSASIFGKALSSNMFSSGNSISISGTYETT